MPGPTEIRLVVFDWAGTTIDFGCMAPAGAFVAAFAERGVTVTTAEARRPMGQHKKDHIRAMLCDPAVRQKWAAAVGREWTEADVEGLYRRVTPMQIEAAKRHAALVPGVLECVAELRQCGLRIAATTGYFREAAVACYTAAAKQGYTPDFTICADEVPAGRPAPWMIFRCMEATGVYPPASVVKVGDTVIDIEDGRNAGCWSVGVVDSSNEMGLNGAEFAMLDHVHKERERGRVREQFRAAGGHAAVDHLWELTGLIDELNGRLARGARP